MHFLINLVQTKLDFCQTIVILPDSNNGFPLPEKSKKPLTNIQLV